jgi:hypothetical protein
MLFYVALALAVAVWALFCFMVTDRLEQMARAIVRLTRRESLAMSLTEDLIAAVTRNTSAVGSVLEYLQSFPAGTVIEDVIAHLNENSGALETAIPANLPPANTVGPTVIEG